jgi:hypothetical protein
MERSSMPTKTVIRFVASARTIMPVIDPSRSVWYSPDPASRTAAARSDRRTVTSPATRKSADSPSASVSAVRAPEMIGFRSPGSHTQIRRPKAVSSEPAVSAGMSARCTSREGRSPASITRMEPPTVAISGDSAL